VSRRCKSVPRSSVTKYLHQILARSGGIKNHYSIHILEWRNEDITERDNLPNISTQSLTREPAMLTFSCFKCFNNFSSRYVRFDKTGVLNGFIIFLTATFWLVRLSFAELHIQQTPSISILASILVARNRPLTRQDQKRPSQPVEDQNI